jgi:hypothetical protein
MKSPSLPDTDGVVADPECETLFNRSKDAWDRLCLDPRPLQEFLALHDRSGRLGNRFESLLLFWLTELLGLSPVHSGVAIREGAQTLGELDFVLRSPRSPGVWEHWEAAVKFYMCTAPAPEGARDPASFVGQALLDRLDLKLAHLFERQLKLGQDPRALPVLQALGVDRLSCSRLFMKGRLYYPLEWDWRKLPGPVGVSAQHERGWWISWDDSGRDRLKTLRLEGGAKEWRVHPKSRWMSPPAFAGSSGWGFESQEALTQALHQHFSDPEAPTLALTGHGVGMILKPGWPQSAVSRTVRP